MTTSCHFPLHPAPGDPRAALCSCEFGYGISIREGRRGELEVKKERKGGSTEQNGVRGAAGEDVGNSRRKRGGKARRRERRERDSNS